jgi:hypothetical protein
MKWLRNILKGVSLTAALFVFQACYGSPQIPDEQLQAQDDEVVAVADEEAPVEEAPVTEVASAQAE